MSRSRALVLVAALGLAGCDVGSLPGIEPDGGPPGGPDGGTSQFACQPAAVTVPSGNHNAGQNCLQAACHAVGGDGPTWTVAGTLYTDAAGNAPNVGGYITIRDALGVELNLAAAQNGNFYTTQPVTYPVTTWASKCPNVRPMLAQSATGDCNAAGCHSQGSLSGRIWLEP
jgi:hypothetical protein